MKEEIVHVNSGKHTIYIGRSLGIWRFGNPFEICRSVNREQAIQRFEIWLRNGITFGEKNATPKRRRWMLNNLHLLREQKLGCWCAPRDCHGRVLLELLNEK